MQYGNYATITIVFHYFSLAGNSLHSMLLKEFIPSMIIVTNIYYQTKHSM